MLLSNIMSNYLNESTMQSNPLNANPIKPKASDWTVEEKRIIKSFDFEEQRFLEQFVVEILKYNRETDAIVEFRVKQNRVGVIIHASSFQITEIETEARRDIDKIKKDVMYYYAK